MISDEELIELAKQAREYAHAPYSKFEVGTALVTTDGKVYSGCNIENSTYGLTTCAERVAIFKAVSEGSKEIARIAVVADTGNLTPPCGACRQIIWEFAADQTIVILANLEGDVEKVEIKDLLPKAFDASFLEGVG